MSNTFSFLSDEEVRNITVLLEALDKSTFDFLQLQVGDLKLTLSNGKASFTQDAAHAVSPIAMPASAQNISAPPLENAASAPPRKADSPLQDGTIEIKAPIIGRFYEKPEPGAAPFVKLGAEVNEDTTVGLIEVMKLFQAVRAGVSGVITEICVEDSQIVEYGQVLFLVRPRR